MAIALEKTWQTNVNQAFSSANLRDALRVGIKDALLGFALNPWVCKYSCGFNGSSQVAGVAGDGVDRWNAATALVWATGVHSWIVLENADGVQICIDLNVGTGTAWTTAGFYASFSAGFTGGTTSARPTATDEITMNTVSTGWGGNTATAHRVHVAMSTDGEQTRVAVFAAGNCCGFIIVDRMKLPRPEITHPFVVGCLNSTANANVTTVANLWTGTGLRTRFGAITASSSISGEGVGGGLVGAVVTTADDINGSYLLGRMGIFSATAGARGPHGQFYDMFWGGTGSNNGDEFDHLGSRDLAVVRDILLPAGGVAWGTA